MKKIKCKDLGGACDFEFKANTFDEIVEMSKNHGKEMFQKKDKKHLEAMNKMSELMQKPKDMERWFESKRQAFENLPDIS